MGLKKCFAGFLKGTQKASTEGSWSTPCWPSGELKSATESLGGSLLQFLLRSYRTLRKKKRCKNLSFTYHAKCLEDGNNASMAAELQEERGKNAPGRQEERCRGRPRHGKTAAGREQDHGRSAAVICKDATREKRRQTAGAELDTASLRAPRGAGGICLQMANNQGGPPPLIGLAIAKEFKENVCLAHQLASLA